MSHRSKLVMVFGTFDLLHEGHLFVLREAMKRGSVTVIVATDANVGNIKGHVPKQSEYERIGAIRVAFPAITVRAGNAHDFLEPIRTRKPDLILLGYDQRLPPGITEDDLPCAIERLPAFDPHLYKSSLMREEV